jgi:RNA polymerase sigma factor (sigma-70 family)
MGSFPPFELDRLLQAADLPDREAAWEDLIQRHTRLILAAARSLGGDKDAVMERYAHVLGKLRENEFRRLRAFDPHAGATFSTWLTVTARRMCLDLYRAHYGRSRTRHASDRSTVMRAARKALNDPLTSELDADNLPAHGHDAEAELVYGHRDDCLKAELARLTPRERLLLTLRFEDNLSASKIASVLGLPSQFHVYRKLNTVLRALRLRLESRGIENSDG